MCKQNASKMPHLEPMIFIHIFSFLQITKFDIEQKQATTISDHQHNNLHHPTGLAVYDNILYFADRQYEAIYRMNMDGTNKQMMISNVAYLKKIMVYTERFKQTVKGTCFLLISNLKFGTEHHKTL